MPNTEPIESLFALFSTFLSSEWTQERHPYKFANSVQAARSAPIESTSRIFLDSGFQAWVAYFVVKPGTANASGQSAQRQRFTALDNLSAVERANLAQRVNAVQPHPTVALRIQSMEHMTQTKQSVAGPVPSKRRYTGDRPGQEYLASPPSTSDFSQHEPRLYSNASQTSINSAGSQEVTSGADVDELDLFPQYLRGAIRRDDAGDRKTAAVSMNFPLNVISDVDCVMTMEVYPNKVERLADLIFAVHLETNGKVREVVLPDGATSISTRLQGSPPERVSDVFGLVTAGVIETAPHRRVEVSDGIVATRCVTMSDFVDADKGATITLTLGRRGASQIFEKLFKSRIHSRYAI